MVLVQVRFYKFKILYILGEFTKFDPYFRSFAKNVTKTILITHFDPIITFFVLFLDHFNLLSSFLNYLTKIYNFGFVSKMSPQELFSF